MAVLPSVLQIHPARVSRLVRHTPELFTFSVLLEENFAFQAGQWVYLHLLDANGASYARAAFSLASAPCEKELVFGVKIYGQFTETLAHLVEGSVIGLQGPFGVFTLPKDDVPLAFFGGGIGVTPLRSLVREALESGSRRAPIVLFWTARSQEDLIYQEEYCAWEKKFEGRFRYHPTLTREPRAEWRGLRGRLTEELFEADAFPWSFAHAFICGPLAFMHDTRALLSLREIEGKPRVHEERFS